MTKLALTFSPCKRSYVCLKQSHLPQNFKFHLQIVLFPAISYSNNLIFPNISDTNIILYLHSSHPNWITKSHEIPLMFRKTRNSFCNSQIHFTVRFCQGSTTERYCGILHLYFVSTSSRWNFTYCR